MGTQTLIMTSYQPMPRHGFQKIIENETETKTNKKLTLLLSGLVATNRVMFKKCCFSKGFVSCFSGLMPLRLCSMRRRYEDLWD